MTAFDLSDHNPAWVLVAGDWHRASYATFPKRVVKLAQKLQIDTILHVGDFGYKYESNDAHYFEKPLHRALLESDVKLVWIDGNHENHQYLRELPKLTNGFVQTGKRGNIYYAPRGHRWNWTGREFGALGGAWSINGHQLKEGFSLFKDLEQPTWQELELLGGKPLDYLLTHDTAKSVPVQGMKGHGTIETQTREVIQAAFERTTPLRNFCGHWHQRKNFTVELENGKRTEVHILNKEWTNGNVVILDLLTNELIAPPENWMSTIMEEEKYDR